jgi:hypothetical protein
MSHELRAVGANRVLTNSTPILTFSYYTMTGLEDVYFSGQPLQIVPNAPVVSIYSVGLAQFWNGAAYQDAHTLLDLTQFQPDPATFIWYTYATPVGLVRGVPDTLLVSAKGEIAGGTLVSANQAITVEYALADQPIGDLAFAAGDTLTKLSQLLNVLKLTQYNKQEVNDISKEQVFYRDAVDANGEQLVGLRFRLKDAAGNLSAREVFRKERN